jgi:insulysin
MKNILIVSILIVLWADCFARNPEPYRVVENQAHLPILTPSFTNRQTLKLKLANELEVYLISDPQAQKSAAALLVEVGSWQDPADYPGLAHFLEHMLFLGTEKYPIESDYDRYIKAHDGESNAFTASDHTVYLFSVNNDAFEEALDRFASFFKTPLFNPSGVSRELQAIDQEFAKNLNNDEVRQFYLYKEMASPKHPFYRFSSGNSKTLSTVSQEVLKQWYQDHYTANLMHLVVYSSLPLETLKALVIQDFKDIINTKRTHAPLSPPLLAEESKGKIVYMTPLKNMHTVRLIWELPPAFARLKETKPEELVCFLLGHEGEGSLLSELKKDNLAEELLCAGQHLGPDQLLFSIYIHLTKEGLQKLDLVIQRCFEAITYLKQQDVPYYLFDEFKTMGSIRYQYQVREDPFKMILELAEAMQREPLETFPEYSYIIQRFDPRAISALLNQLTPEQAFVLVAAKPEETKMWPDRQERWMGIPYTVKPFSVQQLKQWTEISLNPRIRFPEPNPFIPRQLGLFKSSESTDKKEEKLLVPRPEILINEEDAKIYFSQDQEFKTPQTFWFFEIRTPAVETGNPKKAALADLYVKCLKEAMNPYSYRAKLAELEYEIEKVEKGIGLRVQGYSDNAETLFHTILQHLKDCRPSPSLFHVFKDYLRREYKNAQHESPIEQGLTLYQSLLYFQFSTPRQKGQALEEINYEEFLDYLSHLFDQTYTIGLLYGNVGKNQAFEVWQRMQDVLASQPYLISEQPVTRILTLPEDKGPWYMEETIEAQGQATILGIEGPTFSFKNRAIQQILAQAMSHPFYSTLRTKQQTGYIVYNRAEELDKHLFNFFIVQSNTHEPRDLLARFELFIDEFLHQILQGEWTKEQFEVLRRSLLNTIEIPPQNLIEMGQLLKTLAIRYEGDFEWMNKRIQGFKDLSYEEFMKVATEVLARSNKRRLAVFMQGNWSIEERFKYKRLRKWNELHHLGQYTHIKLD